MKLLRDYQSVVVMYYLSLAVFALPLFKCCIVTFVLDFY